MRHHCRKYGHRTTPAWLALFTGVSVLAMMLAAPAHAQQGDFVVDVTDPNVSIDLSVLDDGGLAPRAATPMPGASSASGHQAFGRQAPGPQAPVSTLYIQPSGTFTLPPQTKTLIAEPTPEVGPEATPQTDVAEEAPSAAEPVAETTVETVVEIPPVPPAPEVAAPAAPQAPEPVQDTAKVEPAPEAVPEPEAQPEAPVVQDVAIADPVPDPVPAPAPVAAPEPEPVPEPVKAEPAPQQTPPPPPQALTQDTPPVVPPVAPPVPPAQTTPMPGTGSTVVDLPPKLTEEQPSVASLPSPTGPLSDGDSIRIVFEHDSSKLPGTARDALKALSDRLGQQENLRLQLLAYAGDTDTSASAARRLSLSRALAVRSYLIENGVRSTRIDVRALGNKSTEEVTERVDITVVER